MPIHKVPRVGEVFNPRDNPFGIFTGGIRFPSWVRSSTDIPPGAKLVYIILLHYAGESRECSLPISKIATEVGLSYRHTARMLNVLEDKYWVAKTVNTNKQGKRPNTYHL